jgi:hypothetical protein
MTSRIKIVRESDKYTLEQEASDAIRKYEAAGFELAQMSMHENSAMLHFREAIRSHYGFNESNLCEAHGEYPKKETYAGCDREAELRKDL